MLQFILKRFLLAIPTLVAVLTVVFVLVRVVPGDPTIVILGDQASASARADLRAKLGLDRPIVVQYLTFMGQVATGDIGRSLTTNRPVLEDVAHVLPYTIELTLAAVAIGVGVGCRSASWRRAGATGSPTGSPASSRSPACRSRPSSPASCC